MADTILSSPLRFFIPTFAAKKLKCKSFHPFPRLPAELCIRIWSYALQNETTAQPKRRTVNISKCKAKYRVVLSQRYPTLFAVSREARYETGRIVGGAWVALEAESKPSLQVYIAFEVDTVLLRGCTELFDVGEKGTMWMGRRVEVWKYGRNLESADPMYMVCRRDDEDRTGDGREGCEVEG